MQNFERKKTGIYSEQPILLDIDALEHPNTHAQIPRRCNWFGGGEQIDLHSGYSRKFWNSENSSLSDGLWIFFRFKNFLKTIKLAQLRNRTRQNESDQHTSDCGTGEAQTAALERPSQCSTKREREREKSRLKYAQAIVEIAYFYIFEVWPTLPELA